MLPSDVKKLPPLRVGALRTCSRHEAHALAPPPTGKGKKPGPLGPWYAVVTR